MRVLFQSRVTLFSVPGGDTIQILKTADALRRIGCSVDISTDLEPDVPAYEIVHLFNICRPQELYLQALNAKKQNKKIVLSTIYVSYREYERFARKGVAGYAARHLTAGQVEYLKILARALKNREINKGTLLILLKGYRRLQERIVQMTDLFLPNSESEMKRFRNDFKLPEDTAYTVVPNAVDTGIFNEKYMEDIDDASRFKGCVLCVARIEGLKNQLNLVRAMKGLPWPLVLIGEPAPNHLTYYREIQEEAAGSNVHIIGKIDHHKLPAYYKAAKVHVLPSWNETTGLSSLEAGIMGCNLVITDKGDTRDYFGDLAYYCVPDSVDSIRSAIIKAYETPLDPALRLRIASNYSWEKTAERTMQSYRTVLNI